MWRTKLCLKIAFGLTIGLACGQASGAIFDRDDREYVSTAPGSPYSPVGMVTRGLLVEHRTTGVLVDECDVLTSQHISGFGQSPIGTRLKFTGAIGTPREMSSSGTVIAVGGLKQTRTPAEAFDARGRDWILIRLDKCLGTNLGFAKLLSGPFSVGEFRNLQSAGYPEDRSIHRGLTLDPSCSVTGSRGAVWLDDCAAMPGNSGGPIFRLAAAAGKPRLEVYAIQTAGFPWPKAEPFSPGYENEATPVAPIVSQIEQYLSATSHLLAGDLNPSTSDRFNAISYVGGSAHLSH